MTSPFDSPKGLLANYWVRDPTAAELELHYRLMNVLTQLETEWKLWSLAQSGKEESIAKVMEPELSTESNTEFTDLLTPSQRAYLLRG